MKNNKKESKKSKGSKGSKESKAPKVLLSPEQALAQRRRRKLRRMVKDLRAVCDRKIAKFCGRPIDVPIDAYLPDAVDIVEKELAVMNWKVSRHSEMEGQNPIIRLAMR